MDRSLVTDNSEAPLPCKDDIAERYARVGDNHNINDTIVTMTLLRLAEATVMLQSPLPKWLQDQGEIPTSITVL